MNTPTLPPIANQLSTLTRLFPGIATPDMPGQWQPKAPHDNLLVVPDWESLGFKYSFASWRMLQAFNWLLTSTWNTKVYIDQAQSTHIMRLIQEPRMAKRPRSFHFWDISVSEEPSETSFGLVEGLALLIANPEFAMNDGGKVINFAGSNVSVDGDRSVPFLHQGNMPRIGVRQDIHNEHQLYVTGNLVEADYVMA